MSDKTVLTPDDVRALKCELAIINAKVFPVQAHKAMELAVTCIEQLERAVLAAATPWQEAWQPIETAPMGEVILLYFPRYERPNSVLAEMFKVERWPSHTPRKATLWKRIDLPKSASVSEQKGGANG